MLTNIMNYINNMDKNSRFLLIIICIISFLLVLIFIINYLTSRKVKKQARMQKKYKKKLIEEINNEAKNIEPIKKVAVTKKEITPPLVEEVEVLDEEDEIIEILQDDKESDVDRILREIKEASKEENINLNEFEREQEETAIISYDELCRKAGVKKKIYKAVNENELDVNKIVPEVKSETKKFKATQYVSPIFGVEKENKEEDLDKTFLQSLKEFRSTLD